MQRQKKTNEMKENTQSKLYLHKP